VSFMIRPPHPGKRGPVAHSLGSWVGPRAGLNDMRRDNSLPCWDSNSDSPVAQSVANNYTDWAFAGLNLSLKNKNKINVKASP
jgi:hypothetical protein